MTHPRVSPSAPLKKAWWKSLSPQWWRLTFFSLIWGFVSFMGFVEYKIQGVVFFLLFGIFVVMAAESAAKAHIAAKGIRHAEVNLRPIAILLAVLAVWTYVLFAWIPLPWQAELVLKTLTCMAITFVAGLLLKNIRVLMLLDDSDVWYDD